MQASPSSDSVHCQIKKKNLACFSIPDLDHFGDVHPRYNDRFYYPPASASASTSASTSTSAADIEDLRSIAQGDSIGTQLTWQTEVNKLGEFTAGVQFDVQLRNRQQDYTIHPAVDYFPAIAHPDVRGGTFLQQQWRISRALAVYGGLRLDDSRNFGTSLSPRIALVYLYSPDTTYKVVYGRPFRNPSAFERYYTDGGLAFLANPALRPEAAQTLEGSVEHKLRTNVSVIADVYDYHLSNLITANFLESEVQQFANTRASHSSGVEFELNAKAGHWLETNASYSFGRSVLDNNPAPAVPSRIAKFQHLLNISRRSWGFPGGSELEVARPLVNEIC